MALVIFFYFWFVCFRFPVTKRLTERCVICQLRSTRGDGPWLHQTETSYPTFISTTQQSDTPPPATTETAGGKSGSQVFFGHYLLKPNDFLWKKRHHPSLRNCKLGNCGKCQNEELSVKNWRCWIWLVVGLQGEYRHRVTRFHPIIDSIKSNFPCTLMTPIFVRNFLCLFFSLF